MADHPIDGQIILLAGAKASVPVSRLPGLLDRAQAYVRDRQEEYDRSYERIDGDERAYYCVEDGYWERVGEELGFEARERDAVERTHAAQFRRAGRRLDREAEFETTLEVREVVVVPATRC